MSKRIASRICGAALAGALATLAAAQGDPSGKGAWEPQLTDWPMRATHAALLKTGLILVVDETGSQDPNVTRDTVLFDPISGQIVNQSNDIQQPMGFNLHCSGHAQLDSGRYLFVGGGAVRAKLRFSILTIRLLHGPLILLRT